MKGSIRVEVKNKDEFNSFPVTTTWSWEQDNTIESVEEWIDIFNMILNSQGFHNSIKVGLVSDENVQ